jgi:hypothetical protein
VTVCSGHIGFSPFSAEPPLALSFAATLSMRPENPGVTPFGIEADCGYHTTGHARLLRLAGAASAAVPFTDACPIFELLLPESAGASSSEIALFLEFARHFFSQSRTRPVARLVGEPISSRWR